MSQILLPGANTAAPGSALDVVIRHAMLPGADVDVSAFLVAGNGKVRSDADMVFYGQVTAAAGSVSLVSAADGTCRFKVDTSRLEQWVDKVVFAATIHQNKSSFGAMQSVQIEIMSGGNVVSGLIDCKGRAETALMVCEIYRRNSDWKIRVIGQGFIGGLEALAPYFGVVIAQEKASPIINVTKIPPVVRPVPAAPAPQQAPISLKKITLTKETSSVSLKKDNGRFGKIRVNLNWNQKPAPRGLKSLFAQPGIDLDIGCLVQDRSGQLSCVQALGNTFGDYNSFPYAKLLGDDRSGADHGGEWLEINGEQWCEIKRMLIFTFIYKGVPNWAETDAVVKIMIPDQPEVEVRLNEHGSPHMMCGIAMLENDGGKIRVNREVQFFKGHQLLDNHYHWGMNWVAGRK